MSNLMESKMLNFPAQDGIEVYASNAGFICFKATGSLEFQEEQIVCLTIGQFRKVLKCANDLIADAEANKFAFERAEND